MLEQGFHPYKQGTNPNHKSDGFSATFTYGIKMQQSKPKLKATVDKWTQEWVKVLCAKLGSDTIDGIAVVPSSTAKATNGYTYKFAQGASQVT